MSGTSGQRLARLANVWQTSGSRLAGAQIAGGCRARVCPPRGALEPAIRRARTPKGQGEIPGAL
eukprot:6919774-Prymnesium_polylepis.1